MEEDSLFDLGPDRLNRLLSIGSEEEDLPAAGPDDKGARQAHAERPASAKGADPLAGVVEQPGGWVGRYRLLSVLGEGGMGIVYLAEQTDPVRRHVALKVIKPGMDSKRMIARFEAERQALALLDHPNIAHMYDAGTTEAGHPYFVMECVEGSPITKYCDAYKLAIEPRLRLFLQVCDAVQHAHQKGIIHRDLKPSNIVVTAEGENATPKIIDFGVAKAMGKPLTERTLFTDDTQLLGTPEYMSPEQADMAVEDIDTRSDVYSLGVLLYVLLTGVLPFDTSALRKSGLTHIRKTIREIDPRTPSTRLAGLGEEATTVALNRATQVHTLARHLRQELEWIPLKAMRKERSERYRSAAEMADDIENYLKGAPLIAGPPGVAYRVRKFVGRNRMLVGGVAAVIVVLVAGVVVSTAFAISEARTLAENQLIVDFLENDVLAMASRARVGEATVSYVLDAASTSLDEGKFKDKPLIEASLCEKLAWTYRHIGEPKKAEQQFSRAIAIYRRHLGDEHPDTLRATEDIGWVYEDQGRYRDMESLWARNSQIKQRRSRIQDQMGTTNALGVALYYVGKYREAASLFEHALQLTRTELQGEEVWLLPWFQCNLGRVYRAQGRYEEAERLLVETLKTAEWPEPHSSAKFLYMSKLANTYRQQGRHAEAEQLFDETLESIRLLRGAEHVRTLRCMKGLDRLYIDQGRFSEAQDLLSGALKTARERLREGHPITLGFLNSLAVLRTRQRRYDEAESIYNEVWKGRQRELGNVHPETLETLNDFGVLRREQQRYEEAEALLTEALEGRKAKLGPEHPHTIESLRELVRLYEIWPKPDEAAKWRLRIPGEADSRK